jgi:hypothetical protein
LKGLHYCQATADKKCFIDAMNEILAADPNALLRRRLTNVLVQDWARHWLAQADRLF